MLRLGSWFSGWSELDFVDDPNNVAPFFVTCHCGDGLDDMLVLELVVQVDFYLGAIGRAWIDTASYQLKNVVSKLGKIVTEGGAIVDDDVRDATVLVGDQSELQWQLGGLFDSALTDRGHLDIEVSFLRCDLECQDEEDKQQEDDVDHRRHLQFGFDGALRWTFELHDVGSITGSIPP